MNYYNNYQDILDRLTNREVGVLNNLLSTVELDNLVDINTPPFGYSGIVYTKIIKKFFSLKILLSLENGIIILNPMYFHNGPEIMRLDLVKELNKVFTRERLEYVN